MAMHINKAAKWKFISFIGFYFVMPNWTAFHHAIVDFLVINEVMPLALCGFVSLKVDPLFQTR